MKFDLAGTNQVHRHPDGSIDIGFYAGRAARERTAARRQRVRALFKALAGLVGRVLAPSHDANVR